MAIHTREIYQPPAEDGPVYDFLDDEVEDNRSRAPLVLLIALIILSAFAGVVWLAYNQGVAHGPANGPVVVVAEAGPVRVPPAGDAVEGSVPYTGLKVYGDPVPPDQEAETSTLAEPPEAVPDETPPPATAPQAVALPPQAATPAAQLVTPPQADVPPRAPTHSETSRPTPSPAPATKPPQRLAQVTPGAAASAQAVVKPAEPPKPVETKPQVAPKSVSVVAGKAVLQIGAYPSEALANAAWTGFKAKHAGIIGDLEPDIQSADLGAKGTWYRLRVGPFADKSAANATCERLKSEGATCFVGAP